MPAQSLPQDPFLGLELGHYRIGEKIGSGGMGVVYLARDEHLDREVAVKVLQPGTVADEWARKRLRKEAQALSKLNHPNIATVHDFDIQRDVDFLVMEFIPGVPLSEKLRAGLLPEKEVLNLGVQLAEGLAAAHERGVIHRDLKPGNIRLTGDGRLKILDFGLAKLRVPVSERATADALSETRSLSGTLLYMAPEQLRGEEVDSRSDIHAAGLVLYEMATGQRPFAEIGSSQLIGAILSKSPSPPTTLNPTLSPELDRIIGKCLEKDPENRYQSAKELAIDLRRLQSGELKPTWLAAKTARQAPSRMLFGLRPWVIAPLILALSVTAFGVYHYFIASKAPPFANRDWILVTDFKNQTGEAIFDRVVGDLTGESLSQSNYINVVPRLTAIEAAKRTGLTDIKEIDGNLGRQIALREGYRAILTGDITKSGGVYRIKLNLLDPKSGSTVLSDTASIRSPNELYAAVDHMSSRLRQRLGESLSKLELSKPLAQVTTSSLEALQRYSLALDLYGAREFVRCIALAKDATDRDPDFAMAHLLLAHAYDHIGDGANARAQFHLARGTLEHAGEREQHLILASDYSAQGLDQKSADEYQHLLDIYPDDIEALRGLADSLFWTGRTGDAINTERKALQLNPYSVIDYGQLMTLLIRNSQFTDALDVFDQARSHGLDNPNLRFNAGLASWGVENLQDAQSKFDKLKDESNDYWKVVGQLYSGRLLAYQGRMAAAEEVIRRALALVARPGLENWTPVFHYLLARIAMERGSVAEARAEAQKLARSAKLVSSPESLQRAGRLAIELGNFQAANQFRQLIKSSLAAQDDAFTEMHFYNLSGDIDLANKRFVEAIQNQQQALVFYKGFAAYRSLGQACEESSDWKCAVDAYTNYLRLKGEIIRDDFAADWIIDHYSLARVLAKSGNLDAALASYDTFFKLFSGSDSNLPVIEKAQRESKRLRGLRPNNK